MEHGKRETPSERTPRRREPRKKKRAGGNGRWSVKFIVGTVVLICFCTALMMAGIFMMYVKTTLAPALDVRAEDYINNMSQSSIIYYQDQDSGEWKEYQTVHATENRIWADFEDMPDALWQAAVAIEDERFFSHHGVDWMRTVKATLNMFTNNDTFGGSTITQQVIRNMTQDNKSTVNRKVREIFRALEFEKHYNKTDILEMYLNLIYLGKSCYGVQTAAEYYFGKDLSDLSVAECASLISITNNPSLYGPMSNITITRRDGSTVTPRELNKQRQELILDKMTEIKDPETGEPFLTEEEAQAAKDEVLQFTDGSTSAEDLVEQATGGTQINNWFVDEVIRDVSSDLAEELKITEDEALLRVYNGGYNIYTTMDPDIQAIAEEVYGDRSNLDVTSRNGQQLQSGITIIDPSTGNIAAMVGAVGEKEGNLLTNYARLPRQVGSSMKPLTAYAPALDEGTITPATVFDNYPVQLLNGNPWPKNSPNTYTGRTILSTGIAKSINTIAIQALQSVGVADAFAFATEKLNLNLVAEDMNLSSLGLGGLTYGLTTEEMAAAYAAFANNGVYNSPRTYVRVTKTDSTTGEETVILENEAESHVAMKETTAYLMTKMLKGAVTSGTATSANFGGMTIAGKTGTTSDNYDRYFVGYTPYYCAAVWTGYKSNEKISYSGNPAITMWKKVMQKIHEEFPNKDFDKPSTGLETIQVCLDSGLLPSDACSQDVRGSRIASVEVAAGTGPKETCSMHVLRDYCTEGKCLAGEFCPADSVVQKAFLDYERTDYGSGITAEDNPYLIVNLEKAAESGCPVHTQATEEPENPDAATDPNDPNYIPPTDNSSGEGTEPEEPSDPDVTEPSAGEDWWSDFWASEP